MFAGREKQDNEKERIELGKRCRNSFESNAVQVQVQVQVQVEQMVIMTINKKTEKERKARMRDKREEVRGSVYLKYTQDVGVAGAGAGASKVKVKREGKGGKPSIPSEGGGEIKYFDP
ncbi:hypothetical protein TWF481_009603 [Arthrobotrys musiformis]|uniref:Uncharacterized protein n=1 Tax=Arthrobotrys musiformis TaxID=47236 RepID=A0AAV9W6D4_9PEZI